GYATLLAATALYDLLPEPAALVVAAGIAAVGLALALAWESETLAALGLVGAMLVPATLVFEGGLTTIGTAFAAVVFAALTVVAIAAADLLSGANLTYVWAAEAALLSWLAPRARERSFQLASLAYLALATGHALVFEARPDRLFEVGRHPGAAIPSAVALALAATLCAWYARRFDEPRTGSAFVESVEEGQAELRTFFGAVAGLAGIYALSLGILAVV